MNKPNILTVETPSLSNQRNRNELIKTISLLQSASFYEPMKNSDINVTYQGEKEINGALSFMYSFKKFQDAQAAEKRAKRLGLKTKLIKGSPPPVPSRPVTLQPPQRWSSEAYRRPSYTRGKLPSRETRTQLGKYPSVKLSRQPLPKMRKGRPVFAT